MNIDVISLTVDIETNLKTMVVRMEQIYQTLSELNDMNFDFPNKPNCQESSDLYREKIEPIKTSVEVYIDLLSEKRKIYT